MPTQGLTYPGAPASVNGPKITVERFVKTPSQVYANLSNKVDGLFISDILFANGDANGGAVLYDQVTEKDIRLSGGPTIIAPGGEWPMVNDRTGDPLVAHTSKRGSGMILTYEAVDRDERDTLGRGLAKLANESLFTHNQMSLDAITAAATRSAPAAGAWATATAHQIISDLRSARHSVRRGGFTHYTADTAVIHPDRELEILNKADIEKFLPRESIEHNPVLSMELAGFAGIKKWIVSDQQPEDRVDIVSAKIAGSVRDEKKFYTRVIDEAKFERYIIQAGRISTAIITDPLSIAKITAVAS